MALKVGALFITASLLFAQNPNQSGWKDPQDGWFDLSQMLAQPGRFVPMVMPVTEPAVGYGLAGGPVFLRPRKSEGDQGWTRPNITVAGGMYTSNGSWGMLAADASTWKHDRIQTILGGGHASINLKYFGEGGGSKFDGAPLQYNLTMSAVMAKGRFQIGKSKFYAGLRYLYARVDASPHRPDQAADAPTDLQRVDCLAGPAALFTYDSRDNILTPTKGFFSESNYSYYDPSFGGSINFQRFGQTAILYRPLASRWYLGIRGDADFSFNNPVLYARPYVTLRGIPALRYQRQHLAQTEVELRWQFYKRLSVVGFGGGAVAWNSAGPLRRSVSVGAGGVGFRYLLARKFGLQYGVDFARGPEDNAIYFQFGSAWNRP